MLFLGFSAGLPLLSIWLREAEVERSTVTYKPGKIGSEGVGVKPHNEEWLVLFEKPVRKGRSETQPRPAWAGGLTRDAEE